MGQQPNIELELGDLPRPVPVRGPERRWRPQRPGDLSGPDMPWGGAFGTIGPDTGYVLRLIRRRRLALAPGEPLHNAEIAVALLAGARASRYGRAPTTGDVDVATLLLGYDPEGLPGDTVERLARERPARIANLDHSGPRARTLLGSIPNEVYAATPDEIRQRMADGEDLLDW